MARRSARGQALEQIEPISSSRWWSWREMVGRATCKREEGTRTLSTSVIATK
jgi:hypothetical protein